MNMDTFTRFEVMTIRSSAALLMLCGLLAGTACRGETPAQPVDSPRAVVDSRGVPGADRTAGDARPHVDAHLADGARADRARAPDARVDAAVLPVAFQRYEVEANPEKPAFVTAVDLDKDGKKELVVSLFADSSPLGNGLVAIYSQGASLASWTKQVAVPKTDGVKFPNSISAADIDGDGDLDLFVPYGFLACVPFDCGGLAWLESTGAGGSWKRHDIVGAGAPLFYHRVEHVDIDGDKVADIVTVGESKSLLGASDAQTQIFTGNAAAPDRFNKTPIAVGPGGGSLPAVADFDGDGDLDIVSAEYFVAGESAAWFEQTASGWKKHVVVTQVGPAIQLSLVENLLGNGKTAAVLANHTNTQDRPADPLSAVFLMQIPGDPRQPWTHSPISTGIQSRKSAAFAPQGAPGVFAWGDLDGDGKIDLVVSGDGDPNIYWLRQTSAGAFTTYVLAQNLPQAGVTVADLDGNGSAEVVIASYEASKLLVLSK